MPCLRLAERVVKSLLGSNLIKQSILGVEVKHNKRGRILVEKAAADSSAVLVADGSLLCRRSSSAAPSNGCRRAFLPFNQYNHLNFFLSTTYVFSLGFLFFSDQFFRVQLIFVNPKVLSIDAILTTFLFFFFPNFYDQDRVMDELRDF